MVEGILTSIGWGVFIALACIGGILLIAIGIVAFNMEEVDDSAMLSNCFGDDYKSYLISVDEYNWCVDKHRGGVYDD